MKIGNLTPYIPRDQGPGRSTSDPHTTGFQKVLNDALHPDGPPRAPVPGCVPPVSPPLASTDAVEPHGETAGIHAMELFIDVLEGYRKRLADPNCPLRDIAPALERLEAAHRRLSHVAAETVVEEPLKGIMNEGLVTAAMEIQRFHGGMYC